ncbi:MAG: BlaI/MecI/CopY family transcriptional regulator [Clostridia bacterium]|nr:BlaI/MecI/CopY family transcriptional regulator [Clostridia bacterium]
MNIYQMGAIEARFADIVWQSEPISSAVLCKTAEKEFGWKKSTTYTVLKRLCEKGIFKNENGCVSSLISKEEFYSHQSERFVSENFGGSLPAFIAAFTAKNNLTREQIAELREMIDKFEEE